MHSILPKAVISRARGARAHSGCGRRQRATRASSGSHTRPDATAARGAALAATRGRGQTLTPPPAHDSTPVIATVTNTPYLDAKPVLEALRKDLLPEELRSKPDTELEAAWPGWLSRRDRAIRARLEGGDKDSIANFLLFGTTFTQLPRATGADLTALAGRPSEVPPLFTGRIEDLIAGIVSPAQNERLQFVRHVIERSGIDPEAAGGKDRVRRYLTESLRGALPAEAGRDSVRREATLRHDPIAPLLERTAFRDRGLSSDTSVFIDFGLERTLEAIKVKRLLAADSVGRVGVVGAGLDFTDKHDGYDFYPQQTIQPFAIIDSLMRLGLAKSKGLHLTTFDINPRINQHLEAARQRARAGIMYPLALPRNMDLALESISRGVLGAVWRQDWRVRRRTLRCRPTPAPFRFSGASSSGGRHVDRPAGHEHRAPAARTVVGRRTV